MKVEICTHARQRANAFLHAKRSSHLLSCNSRDKKNRHGIDALRLNQLIKWLLHLGMAWPLLGVFINGNDKR